jgi:hypothetical protein
VFERFENFFLVEVAGAEDDAGVMPGVTCLNSAIRVKICGEIYGHDVFVKQVERPDVEGCARQINTAGSFGGDAQDVYHPIGTDHQEQIMQPHRRQDRRRYRVAQIMREVRARKQNDGAAGLYGRRGKD